MKIFQGFYGFNPKNSFLLFSINSFSAWKMNIKQLIFNNLVLRYLQFPNFSFAKTFCFSTKLGEKVFGEMQCSQKPFHPISFTLPV
jgi:hypothetical protein